MVLPLKVNFGSLPPDIDSNSSKFPTQNVYENHPISSNISTISNQPAIRSYAHVTSTPPAKNFSPRISLNLHKEVSLYRSFDFETESPSTANIVHKTGTTENSVFYCIPHNLKHLRVAFSIALSDKFPFGVGLGLTSQRYNR